MINQLFNSIRPAKAMGIRVHRFEKGCIELVAPLAPNLNDKGTAFAGSISSMLTLAGWALITLHLKEAGMNADVMVVKSETEYTTAVRAALFVEATLSEAERAQLFQTQEKQGRSRICIQSHLHSNGEICARMTAHYAVISH